jgi:hypothetical protein
MAIKTYYFYLHQPFANVDGTQQKRVQVGGGGAVIGVSRPDRVGAWSSMYEGTATPVSCSRIRPKSTASA